MDLKQFQRHRGVNIVQYLYYTYIYLCALHCTNKISKLIFIVFIN